MKKIFYIFILFYITLSTTYSHQWDVDTNQCHHELFYTSSGDVFFTNYHCHRNINFNLIELDEESYELWENLLNEFKTFYLYKIKKHLEEWWNCNNLDSIYQVEEYIKRIYKRYWKSYLYYNYSNENKKLLDSFENIDLLYKEYLLFQKNGFNSVEDDIQKGYPNLNTSAKTTMIYNTFISELNNQENEIKNKYEEYLLEKSELNEFINNLNSFQYGINNICINEKSNIEINNKAKSDSIFICEDWTEVEDSKDCIVKAETIKKTVEIEIIQTKIQKLSQTFKKAFEDKVNEKLEEIEDEKLLVLSWLIEERIKSFETKTSYSKTKKETMTAIYMALGELIDEKLWL